jgi:hypothetical protein
MRRSQHGKTNSPLSDVIVHLFALASRLEGEGQYNLAKLARAGADTLCRKSAYHLHIPSDKVKLVSEIEKAIQNLSIFYADTHARVAILQDFPHGLNGLTQNHFHERALAVEEGAQHIIDRQHIVLVRHVEQISGDIVDPVVYVDLTAGRAEEGLTREVYLVLILASRADVEGVARIGVTAEHHALDSFTDICLLIR